eukprot:TRINITY_DN29708_c0_g1_i11.p2 TRINITY_DN29708_c0_g1~~TRINITY_DN29708_c0_g1_i11.p2  ORF type:complete len:171 (+),score=12.16 TRINITY_DN29708_c0_g1_i11:185-697(+)
MIIVEESLKIEQQFYNMQATYIQRFVFYNNFLCRKFFPFQSVETKRHFYFFGFQSVNNLNLLDFQFFNEIILQLDCIVKNTINMDDYKEVVGTLIATNMFGFGKCFVLYYRDINYFLSSGQTLGVKAQRFRGHTSPHRNVKEKKKYWLLCFFFLQKGFEYCIYLVATIFR